MPLAIWPTILVNAAIGWLLGHVLLHHLAPGLFDPTRRNLRGGNLGDGYVALVAGISVLPLAIAWVRALRRHGYDVGFPPRR